MSDYDIQTETTDTTTNEVDAQEGAANTDFVKVRRADLEDIHIQLEELRSMQMARGQTRQAPPSAQPRFEDEAPSIPAEVVSDPAKLAAYIKKTTEMATQKATKAIANESQKTTWDKKAEQDFPLGDAAFNKAVKSQIREMTATGEYSPDNPMLVYRAAQLASLKLGTAPRTSTTQTKTSDEADADPRPSSVGTSTGGSSGTGTRSRSKIPDNHPTVRAYKLFNRNATKEDVERLKASLEKQGSRIERRERNNY
jgi:hypothetical protein